ncbi:MAG: hypothetical protein KAW17_04400 [Candidatus Eisenbacteria sp.]|nr:hypothetical protein [Candidatus Eisenbacteria bacterium]
MSADLVRKPGKKCGLWIGRVLALICLILILPGSGAAQEETRLQRAKRYYQAGEYGESIVELEGALVRSSRYNQEELATIHLYLGLAWLGMDRPERARKAFAESIRLDTKIKVDPTLRSPEVEEVFERARWVVEEEHSRIAEEEGPEGVPLGRAIVVPRGETGKTRWGGIWRSTVLPGWGQIYGGRKIRGYTFMVTEIAILTAAINATIERGRAYDDYQDARETASIGQVNALHDDYNSLRRTAETLSFAAAGVWAFNIIESLLNDPGVLREGDRAAGEWRVGGVSAHPDGWSVRICRSF